MLTNYHTHTTYCDGKNTPEEIVLRAIEEGFDAIGFSGHGYTSFDESYCMKDISAYISDIGGLKEKYKGKIQIYLGYEEDAFAPSNREDFDYIIGSSHYFYIDGKYCPIDSNYEYFHKCLSAFDGDIIKLADSYYSSFCDYIIKRKPDIVGHFDLITKFDEMDSGLFLENNDYLKLSEKYMERAISGGAIFEVNTGAIARGLRTTPYPYENLLYVLKKHNAKIILSSDSHSKDTLDCNFEQTRKLLYDVGFRYVYMLYDNEFQKDYL